MTAASASPAPGTEEAGAHDAERFAFALGEADYRAAGIPLLLRARALSRREVRGWTFASLVAGVLFGTLAAALLSSGGADQATTTRGAPVVEEPGTQAVAAPPELELPLAGVPLSALPLVKEASVSTSPSPAARRAVKPARVKLADQPRPTVQRAKPAKASRGVAPLRATPATAASKPTTRRTASTKQKVTTTTR